MDLTRCLILTNKLDLIPKLNLLIREAIPSPCVQRTARESASNTCLILNTKLDLIPKHLGRELLL
jgi:hypothetical protein